MLTAQKLGQQLTQQHQMLEGLQIDQMKQLVLSQKDWLWLVVMFELVQN